MSMNIIPFFDLIWPASTGEVADVARRLQRYLVNFRMDQLEEEEERLSLRPEITAAERARIRRRAERYVAARDRQKMLPKDLKHDDRKRLIRVKEGAHVVAISSEHRADEIASAIHEEMPWMDVATERVWRALRRSVREGHRGLRLPPQLLVGPAGVGKSHWARSLGKKLCLPTTVMDAIAENASFSVAGCQRGWTPASPGRPLEMVLDTRLANGLVVIDEVEKSGAPTSRNGLTWSLTNALLAFLEPSTARAWSCPYFRVTCDMSWLGWVLTANSTIGLPGPLPSRVPPTRTHELSNKQLIDFALRRLDASDLDHLLGAVIIEIIESAAPQRRPSLRTIVRMIHRAEDLAHRPVLH
ncbi:AAA family ATPase [Jannaschia formosa]|uniref:AAA family ATPase n=1 Tax=Jannaschia formosa TaxID=2259592 RepID=UPI000E1BA52D|nr:AAA family ATPase [Jannaschia formosa]TFL17736.1 hypothetical protein DR046_12590 [Jannaschia formosa]